MFTRYEAFAAKPSESNFDPDGYEYDSDDSLPPIAEKDVWYSFENTERSMARLKKLEVGADPLIV